MKEIIIPTINKFTAEKNERLRVGRMKNHPHSESCDMSGDIVLVEKDYVPGTGGAWVPGGIMRGTVTECTSCRRQDRRGSLRQ